MAQVVSAVMIEPCAAQVDTLSVSITNWSIRRYTSFLLLQWT